MWRSLAEPAGCSSRKNRARVEVLNDIDGELMNFFRVVKNHPEELIRSFDWDLSSREEFNRLLRQDPAKLSEVERAHRFYYIIMASWGGELGSARFQTSVFDQGHGNRLVGALQTLEQRIRPAYKRLQTVIIESLSWEECMKHYDSEGTFFYLDPPYPANRCNYQHNMRSWDSHRSLAEHLRQLKAKWLLSTYDTEEIRDTFAGCELTGVSFPSGMAGNGYRNKEILITNYGGESR